ncbi:hypothetical protein NAEGRDRAFT_58820 [Naegleria gruberi]|uniref:Ankyrin repeat domain-containing protein n=1 Tax=Naegleria gruberi TaxID=5762 RepID=D2VP79_NAEGR|nr:uncharacterized protein NAEGRDRAFT_58820 [Naegleria gruberi]EFC41383.1 hypothetical protein NAEGRDRAFT_58820 [Naegleria gruberi]|eukprot:XP_002674127.1 hypothetical protein NAEGRDRAFT_58820 [Naegleria gruberi strain NEG-M]
MPPKRASKKETINKAGTTPKRKSRSTKKSQNNIVADDMVDQDFYVNLWGQEVNEDLMQYILDFVPVYPDQLNMRAVNRFWKNNLEKVFFPKVKVLDLLTREKYQIEKFKSTKLKQMAGYFPNFTKLRVCQSGWEIFFQQPNKIETFEFFDLECVAVATGFMDLLNLLMECHKKSKHPSYLKTINIYGSTENDGYYYYNHNNNLINYINGKPKKNEIPMSSLESINLKYHNVASNILSRFSNVKSEKPINEYDNVLEYWDMLVYEENINWNLLHPFKIVDSLKNDELFDIIIEYAKAQEIPVKLSNFESELYSNDLTFNEFYKKFVDNNDLEPHLRYKMDNIMFNRIFIHGNDHLLNQVIENKYIPLIIENATNPLASLISNERISLFKKALEREPTLINLGNSNGIIEGTKADLNLFYVLCKSYRYSYNSLPLDTAKFLVEIVGVDINYTSPEGSLLNSFPTTSTHLLPLFETIKLETLEKKNSHGLDTIEQWASRLKSYGSYNALEFLKFFNKIYQNNNQELKHYRTSDGGNLLHVLSKSSMDIIEYCITTLGIDVTHKNNDGMPALFAVDKKVLESTSLLQKLKKDLEVRDAKGKTLLCKSLENSENLSYMLVKEGCDLEYALSNLDVKSKFFEFKKGESFINGAKLLLMAAFEQSIDYFLIFKQNLEVLKNCLEIEITMSSDEIGEVTTTPIHAYLMLGIESSTIIDLGLIGRKSYILNRAIWRDVYFFDETEGRLNNVSLAAKNGFGFLGYKNEYLEEKSSITELNSWMLAIKYGHYDVAKNIINYLGASLEDCKSTIIEIATANLQYHILEESLKQKLSERNLGQEDKKLISGYIFNFTDFSNFSDLEPYIEDFIDSDILEQKCIVQIAKRKENSELQEFFNSHIIRIKPSTIKFVGKMYNTIHEPITYHLSMLEVCLLKGYPLKKVQEKLKTEKEILQFLSRKEKESEKTIMHLMCDCSLPIYFNVGQRELQSFKYSVIISLLSKLSAASKKQVLNLLDANHETPIFSAIRSESKNLIKSLAPNTDMSLKNLNGKNCLEISSPEISEILIQYADKKTLASKRQVDEEQKSRKKRK